MAKAARQVETSGTRNSLRRELWPLIWHERLMLSTAFVCAVAAPVAAMSVPFAAKLVIDEVIGRGRTALLLPITLGAGLALVLQALTVYGTAQAGAVASQRIVVRLRLRLQRHALHLPVSYFDRTPTGTVVSRLMNDSDQVRLLFGTGLLELVSGIISAVLALVILVWLDWRLAVLIALVLLIAITRLARGYAGLHPAFRAASELQASLGGRLTEVIGGIRVVKSCTAERREAFALAQVNHRLARASIEAQRHVAVLAAVIVFGTGVVTLGLLVLGAQIVASGSMTLGDIALLVFLIGILSAPVVQVATVGTELSRAIASLARIREVLALPLEQARTGMKVSLPRLSGAVTCDDVGYSYLPGHPVLRHVSLHAPAGATIAIMGPNGAGKSTLLSLLAGFDDPTEGHILIDGQPLSALDRSAYRGQLGVVLQRDQLINGSVADNIRYARPGASTTEFRRAVRLAHCDEFVEQLPNGYETLVGERGLRLSGGQRQRVAIARAMLADPRILLLDEATTHLDGESEALIQDALWVLFRGRTTFVISHRPSIVRRADQILMLHDGVITVQGATDAPGLQDGTRFGRSLQMPSASMSRGLLTQEPVTSPDMQTNPRNSGRGASRNVSL